MRKLYNQLSISDIYDECKNLFNDNESKFITLLKQTIDFADFIPQSFYNAFYQHFGRNRKFSLESFISALILQKIYSIPTDALLIIFLKSSKELRDFCGFSKVPDASKFTRFKQDFIDHLTTLFNNLVDYTEPICHAINDTLASALAYDTSGIEAYVAENNSKCPKFTKGICNCKNPCSTAKHGRTTYTFEDQNFRMLPGIVRDSQEWVDWYKKRCVVERTINHFKSNMCVADRKSRNLSTTKADLLFAGIAQLFTVVIADKLNNHKLIRSLKPLIA